MPSFRIPYFLRRRSFHRLRSFHLTPAEAAYQASLAASQAPPGSTKSRSIMSRSKAFISRMSISNPLPCNMVVSMRGSTIVVLALIASLFFIFTISFAFIGADVEESYFMNVLDDVAQKFPGIVLLGESVDVDVDEPSITIRWSIIECGADLLLPGSAGVHGSKLCGLPSSALQIFVDNNNEPAATYDPLQIPFDRYTGNRRSIQNLVQFDSDHVLDVHEARLYPFDTYMLSSTLRAVTQSNESIPIRRAVTIDVTSSFDIQTVDMESYTTSSNGTQSTSRDIDMHVRRPNEARAFTLLLFGVSWILTHVTIAHVFLARRLTKGTALLKHLISTGAILVSIPQLRNSMPDAPGFDGVLIDSIGYFPQMVISSCCVIIIILFLFCKELDVSGHKSLPSINPMRQKKTSGSNPARPPAMPTANSSSTDIKQYELHRLMKHLQGQYVFPPVQPSHRLQPSDASKHSHRRVKTMSKIMEAGEMSHWSDSD